jgi:hypothetical protein
MAALLELKVWPTVGEAALTLLRTHVFAACVQFPAFRQLHGA